MKNSAWVGAEPAAGGVDLRIHTRVLRPRPEVTAGDREAERRHAQGVSQASGAEARTDSSRHFQNEPSSRNPLSVPRPVVGFVANEAATLPGRRGCVGIVEPLAVREFRRSGSPPKLRSPTKSL